MATSLLSRSLLSKPFSTKTLTLTSFLSRSINSSTASSTSTVSPFNRFLLRPIAASIGNISAANTSSSSSIRSFSTRPTSSSLNDPSPNWSNRPPKETILLDGCDFEHWLIVVEAPQGEPTRDEIIDSYIKTLAQIVGSEEEARMKIYSVSTRCYYAFGALVSEELSYKLKEIPGVRWVLPDSYLDVRNKDYGGEPFINGQAVPYDPKYHAEWIRNNQRANERNRRNDRPRNFDRSRNFDRRENMNAPRPNMSGPPPQGNVAGGPPAPQNMRSMPPPNMAGPPPQRNMGGPPPPQNNMGGMPPQNMGGMPPQHNGGQMPPPNMPPQSNMGQMPPQSNMGQMPPQNNMGQMPPQNNMGQMPQYNNAGPNAGWSGGNAQNYHNNQGSAPNQGGPPNTNYQNFNSNREGNSY
ncbi:hypothetical protein ACFE04_023211 [Oxalis oulophora]